MMNFLETMRAVLRREGDLAPSSPPEIVIEPDVRTETVAPIQPLQPGWRIVYLDRQGRLQGGSDDSGHGTVATCLWDRGTWTIHLTDGQQVPLSRIKSVAVVWTTRGDSWGPGQCQSMATMVRGPHKDRSNTEGDGTMTHYWGSKAIVERIGLRDARRMPHLIKRWGLPAFLRRAPGHLRSCYYISESAVTAWELARGMRYREILLAKEQAHGAAIRDGIRAPKRIPST